MKAEKAKQDKLAKAEKAKQDRLAKAEKAKQDRLAKKAKTEKNWTCKYCKGKRSKDKKTAPNAQWIECDKCSFKMHLNCISENHDRATNIKAAFDLIGDDEDIEFNCEECEAN